MFNKSSEENNNDNNVIHKKKYIIFNDNIINDKSGFKLYSINILLHKQ